MEPHIPGAAAGGGKPRRIEQLKNGFARNRSGLKPRMERRVRRKYAALSFDGSVAGSIVSCPARGVLILSIASVGQTDTKFSRINPFFLSPFPNFSYGSKEITVPAVLHTA